MFSPALILMFNHTLRCLGNRHCSKSKNILLPFAFYKAQTYLIKPGTRIRLFVYVSHIHLVTPACACWWPVWYASLSYWFPDYRALGLRCVAADPFTKPWTYLLMARLLCVLGMHNTIPRTQLQWWWVVMISNHMRNITTCFKMSEDSLCKKRRRSQIVLHW